mmetsp:Transcript_10273/g.23731  ORF Transcript_10273/g.23731 Transcript_10273/m.23731 type:complete len:108 (+) Transcript_10273:568-891(+)
MEDLTKMLDHIETARSKALEMQKKLAQIQATREAGAGAVKATVNGHKQILKLDIDQTFIRPEEKEALQDLIIAAITLAIQAVEDQVKTEINKSTAGMLGDIPINLTP